MQIYIAFGGERYGGVAAVNRRRKHVQSKNEMKKGVLCNADPVSHIRVGGGKKKKNGGKKTIRSQRCAKQEMAAVYTCIYIYIIYIIQFRAAQSLPARYSSQELYSGWCVQKGKC